MFDLDSLSLENEAFVQADLRSQFTDIHLQHPLPSPAALEAVPTLFGRYLLDPQSTGFKGDG